MDLKCVVISLSNNKTKLILDRPTKQTNCLVSIPKPNKLEGQSKLALENQSPEDPQKYLWAELDRWP